MNVLKKIFIDMHGEKLSVTETIKQFTKNIVRKVTQAINRKTKNEVISLH